MATTLSFWQWVGISVAILAIVVFWTTSRVAIRCNIFTGLLSASPKKTERVKKWFEKVGGYDPRVHSGAVLMTVLSFFVLVATLILLAPHK